MSSKRRTLRLDSFRVRREDRGDRRRGVDQRDLHIAVPRGAFDERQGDEDPSASAKCSPAAALGGWVFMGRTPFPV
jgi:hypothetical protein